MAKFIRYQEFYVVEVPDAEADSFAESHAGTIYDTFDAAVKAVHGEDDSTPENGAEGSTDPAKDPLAPEVPAV